MPIALARRRLVRFAFPLVVACATGCGSSFGDVTGKVTYNTHLLTSGSVMLLASDGRPYDGTIDEAGTYTIRKVPIGPAKIAVSCLVPVVKEGKSDPKKADARVTRSEDPKLAATSAIPTRYGNFAASNLEVRVEPGRTPHDITLID